MSNNRGRRGNPPSAFIIFANKRRHQLRISGNHFEHFSDLLDFVKPDWLALPETEKKYFKDEALARRDALNKERPPVANPFLENSKVVADKIREAENAEIARHNKSLDTIEALLSEGDIKSRKLILVHTNYFCAVENTKYLLPAELAFSTFTFGDGIIDNYWILVDPGAIMPPDANKNDAYYNSEELDIPMPGYLAGVYDENSNNYYLNMVADINSYVFKHDNRWMKPEEKTIVFCLNRDMKKITGCMDWIYMKAEKAKKPFDLYSYEQLVLTLYDLGRLSQSCVDDMDSLFVSHHIDESEKYRNPNKFLNSGMTTSDFEVEDLLKKVRGGKKPLSFEMMGRTVEEDQFDYLSSNGIFLNEMQVEMFSHFGKHYHANGSLACLYHQQYHARGYHKCSLHTVNRQAYMILEHLSHSFGVELEEGIQRPANMSEEKERRKFLLAKWYQYGYH